MANEKQIYVMARVMGELPSGQKLIGIMANNADGVHFFTEDNQFFTADDILLAADAVPVVRCKDCMKSTRVTDSNFDYCLCKRSHLLNTANDFCSYGERKE